MAKPKIDFTKVDRNDPRFLELDPDNPNTNISASKFDPTDPTSKGNPVGEKYNEWLKTANVGDTFDWGKESGDPTQKGVSSTFTGFNKMGTPIIQTNISEERANWQGAIGKAGPSYEDKMKALMNTGRNETEARFLLAQYFGPEYVSTFGPKNVTQKQPVGVLADGTPFYGWDSQGKPVTSPTGTVYSTKSPSDAVTSFNSGSSPLSSSTTASTTAATTASTAAQSGTMDPNKMARQSAYDFLFEQFSQYGLGSLVEDIKGLVESNVSPSEFTIRLRQTPAYKQRFAANDARVKAGYRALSEGEYISLEDQYQNILRNYGLPKSYYEKDSIGRQAGFERFIAGDVSPAEVEDRLQLGINRVKNAAPEVEQTLRQFYPGITQGDILAYTLDPEKALTDIQRKVQAAEIGAEAVRAGLSQTVGYAEELQSYGVTKETAQQGFQTIAGFLPRASTLGDIYAKQGMGPYTQTTAEQEVFGLPSAAQAATKRRKLTELEQAQFSGQAGVGALARERAGQF